MIIIGVLACGLLIGMVVGAMWAYMFINALEREKNEREVVIWRMKK